MAGTIAEADLSRSAVNDGLRQRCIHEGEQVPHADPDGRLHPHGVGDRNCPRPYDHIGFLPRIHASAMDELDEMGIESINDIPDDFELTEIQRRAATCVQTGEPWYSPELRDPMRKT